MRLVNALLMGPYSSSEEKMGKFLSIFREPTFYLPIGLSLPYIKNTKLRRSKRGQPLDKSIFNALTPTILHVLPFTFGASPRC